MMKLEIHPDKANEAIALLAKFVAERAALLEDKTQFNAVAAIRMMDALNAFKEKLAAEVKSPVEKAYDRLRFTIIPELMDEEGITTLVVDGVGRTSLTDDISVKVLDTDRSKEWLIEQEAEDLIKETVNAQTLAAFMRKRIKAGMPVPAEIFTVTPFVRASITRTKESS